jgi:hypothetical protein
MKLQIICDSGGTHADVSLLKDGQQPDGGGHVLRSGESYLGVGYEHWNACRGGTVDLLALQSRAWKGGSALPSSAARLPRSGFGRAYLRIGLPSAVLASAAVELLPPVFAHPGRSIQRVLVGVLLLEAPLFALIYMYLGRPTRAGEPAAAPDASRR